MKQRVNKIFNNVDKEIDAILIFNSSEPFIDINFFYVTNITKGLFENSAAILYPDGNVKLIVSELEQECASKAKVELDVYGEGDKIIQAIADSIKSVNNLGINFKNISHHDFYKLQNFFHDLNFFDVSSSFTKSRMVKDKLEIEQIGKAARIADEVASKIPDILHEGLLEYELAAEIDFLMQKNGADSSAFETISSFGSNSAMPHYTHGNQNINRNDLVLCDFGAKINKYNSDITRTFVFGTPSEKQNKMYETVLKAQKLALQTIEPGIQASDVHKKVAEFIDKTEFKGRFIHSTGHSLGLNVHDGGVGFRSFCDTRLEENMVLTVEPGVYIPGYGGVRIEDDIVVKKDGAQLLTKCVRKLV